MLVAYLDEFGHVGPYIHDDHKKYCQHPFFGYAGFVVPAEHARRLGSTFHKAKKDLFLTEIQKSDRPNQWERKGSDFFSTGSIQTHPQQVRVFNRLLDSLRDHKGHVFYYGEQKPIGTLKQTKQEPGERTRIALEQTINRLCTHAEKMEQELLIIMDQITDKSRKEIVAQMYSHVYWRSKPHVEHPEMRRIIDAPLHVESNMNSAIQFADWICALIARLSHSMLYEHSPFHWAVEKFGDNLRRRFTYESKLHMHPEYKDVHNSDLLVQGAHLHAAGTIGGEARIPEKFLSSWRK